MLELLDDAGALKFERIWPAVLAECHITLTDLKGVLREMRGSDVAFEGMLPNQRALRDEHVVRLLR